MNHIAAVQRAQEEAYKRAISNQLGGNQHQAMQSQDYAQVAPAPAAGVLSMTEEAHAAFQRLSNVLGDLQERLSPITESYPELGHESGAASQSVEASAVMGLRILVERIDVKAAEMHRLLNALRV